MGLLDDAIREHLELKRRRGADAGDISREESEALGPVRRRPDGSPDLTDTFADPRGQPPGFGEYRRAPADEPSPDAGDPPSAGGEGGLGDGAHEPTHASAYESPSPPGYEPPSPSGYEPPSPSGYEPPTAAYEPPSPSGYEPPTAPAYELPSRPAYEPPSAPGYEPPSPESGYEPPAVVPAEPQQWFQAPGPPEAPEPEPEGGGPRDPEPEPESPTEAAHASLLSRFRMGRRAKAAPAPPAADASIEPPALPGSHEAYEPPPATPPSYGYQPPPTEPEPDIVPADDEPVDDVLEETPDFLEETPEHDRLWFEQRPPRDFDFDDK